MPPLTLEGSTLGEKHKSFNNLVKDAVENKQTTLTNINDTDGDIDNLLKIDTACKTRNVDYVIDVLKCDDMLYVSKAIKLSTWLLTEKEFAHIINPEYLFTQLFPHMLAKGINKLLLRIRLTLKDETRVENFYNYLIKQDEFKDIEKWLLNCSIPFTENVIENERNISIWLFKRLCRRSVTFLKYYTKVEERSAWRALSTVLFLLNTNTEEYMNVLDKSTNYCLPKLRKRHTEVIMKKCPNRILDNFERYMTSVNISIVAKYINKEDIKDFVLKHAKNENTKYFFRNYESLKYFIKTMPKESRFEFVKNICIDKNINTPAPYASDAEECCESDCLPSCSVSSYNWYQYAPFNEAFIELKKIIRAESSPTERCSMLSVLLTCARGNPQNAKTVLQYYYDKHRNEPFKFKIQFVNNLICQSNARNFDTESWHILDHLFHSLEVYIESENNVQTCLKAIVLYKVLNDEPIPDIVVKKMTFDTFKNVQRKLSADHRTKLFSYLLSSVTTKLTKTTVTTETSSQQYLGILTDALNLLKDWKQDLKQHPFVLEKIQDLIKLEKDNSWNSQISDLYEINKSWRKYLFEQSLILSPTEETCLNALRHDPQLLVRYSDKVSELRTYDNISLQRFLAKLRIYWQHSIAQEWTNAYLNNLDKSTGHKALIQGLFSLLPRDEVMKMAKKYTPTETKIDWSTIDPIAFGLQKNIAINLYIARPLVSLDVVLWYAKGDYLQYAVPSLNSIIHNISKVQSHDHLSKLLEAPVSLQKFGLHLAFIKSKHEDLKPLFSSIWKTTKNSTIRTHLFTHTYNLLCKIKEPTMVKELWELLGMFIDNLATDENKNIYSKLGKPKNIHASIQGEFFMKSFKVLSSLPAGANCESHKTNLINFAPDIVDILDTEFVENILLGSIKEGLTKPKCELIEILASYAVHGASEDEQFEKYKRFLLPVLEHAFTSWNTIKDDEYIVKDNIDTLTKALTWDVIKYLPSKKIFVPVKVFNEIEKLMADKLPIAENYERYACFKLTSEYVKLIAEHREMFFDEKLDKLKQADYIGFLPDDADNIWEAVRSKIAPKFGPIITKQLKEDTSKYFPTICWLFCGALTKAFYNLSVGQGVVKMETLRQVLVNNDYIPSYIVVCEEMPNYRYGNEEEKKKLGEVLKILSSHPSLEVKMHYEKAFAEFTQK